MKMVHRAAAVHRVRNMSDVEAAPSGSIASHRASQHSVGFTRGRKAKSLLSVKYGIHKQVGCITVNINSHCAGYKTQNHDMFA